MPVLVFIISVACLFIGILISLSFEWMEYKRDSWKTYLVIAESSPLQSYDGISKYRQVSQKCFKILNPYYLPCSDVSCSNFFMFKDNLLLIFIEFTSDNDLTINILVTSPCQLQWHQVGHMVILWYVKNMYTSDV